MTWGLLGKEQRRVVAELCTPEGEIKFTEEFSSCGAFYYRLKRKLSDAITLIRNRDNF